VRVVAKGRRRGGKKDLIIGRKALGGKRDRRNAASDELLDQSLGFVVKKRKAQKKLFTKKGEGGKRA